MQQQEPRTAMATLCNSIWRGILLFLLLLCASPFPIAADPDEVLSRAVLELTDSTFDAAIAKHDHIFVDFYAPWCGHCKVLSSELDAAAAQLVENIPPIILAKINADKYTKLASKYGVSAYPTLKFFINGLPIDYIGPRKAAALTSHLRKLVSPDVKELRNELELQDFLQNADESFPFFIGFGLQKSAILELAKKYKSRAWFLVVESLSEEAMNFYDFDKGPALIIIRPGQDKKEVYYGPFEGNDLAQFVQQNLLPRVSLVTPESLKSLTEDGRAIALAILKDKTSEQSVSFIKMLKAAAPANRAFIFAYVDALQWSSFAANFEINQHSSLPILVIWDGDSTYHVNTEGYDFSGEKAEAYITFFLQEFRDGKASRQKVGPSFMEFITSNIGVKTVYILVFVVGVIIFAQNIWGSENAEMGKRHGIVMNGNETNHGHSRSLKSSSSSDLNSNVAAADKED